MRLAPRRGRDPYFNRGGIEAAVHLVLGRSRQLVAGATRLARFELRSGGR